MKDCGSFWCSSIFCTSSVFWTKKLMTGHKNLCFWIFVTENIFFFFLCKEHSFKFCLCFGKVHEYLGILLLLLLANSCRHHGLQLYSNRHPYISASRERRGKSQPSQNPITMLFSGRLESFIKYLATAACWGSFSLLVIDQRENWIGI